MDKKLFINEIKKIFPKVHSDFFENVDKYKTYLQEYNQKINLTRLDQESKIYGEYFYESLVPFKNVGFRLITKVMDIGSGSGIPGVALKLLFPHIELTIIESNGKKVTFLNGLARELKISINVINKRAEEIDANEYEKYDLVTSRAVAPLPFILELSLPYVRIGGLVVEPKSLKINNELERAHLVIKKMGGVLIQVDNFKSINNLTHNIVVIKKIANTPHTYPRGWKDIVKGFK